MADSALDVRRLVAIAGADHNDPVLLSGDALIDAVADLAEEVEQGP